MIQKIITIYGQVISAGELVVKAQYIRSMQENANWYWDGTSQHQDVDELFCVLVP